MTTESESKGKEKGAVPSPASSSPTKPTLTFVPTIMERTDPGGMVIVGVEGHKKSQVSC